MKFTHLENRRNSYINWVFAEKWQCGGDRCGANLNQEGAPVEIVL